MDESPAQGAPPGEPAGQPGGMSASAWLLLIAYSATLLLLFLGSSRTLNSRESYVAVGASEMLATGDWLVPRLGGKPWLEKPPLPQWIVAAFSGIVGEMDEWVARIPAAIAGLIGVLLVAGVASRWFGATHGLLAGLVQATTVYTLNYARLATSDMYLWAIVVGILALFARNFVGPPAPPKWYSSRMAFFVLLGLTQLVKGPLFGAVMALLPCLGFAVWQRQWSSLRWFLYWPGILVCTVIAVAWPATILWRYPDAADIWWLHTFGRLDEHGVLGAKPPWYYLTTLPWQIAPWTLLALAGAAPSVARAWRGTAPADRFAWAWLVMPLAALSAVAGKHPHYLIYALPPCSIWAADGLIRFGNIARRALAPAWRLRLAGASGFLGLSVFGCWAVAMRSPFALDGLVLGSASLLGMVVAAWRCRRADDRGACISLFATLWLAVIYLQVTLVPRSDLYREENALYRAISDLAGPETPILVYQMDPGQALFYCRTQPEVVPTLDVLQARLLAAPQSLVVTQALFEPDLRRLDTMVRIAQTTPSPRNPDSQFIVLRTERLAVVPGKQRTPLTRFKRRRRPF